MYSECSKSHFQYRTFRKVSDFTKQKDKGFQNFLKINFQLVHITFFQVNLMVHFKLSTSRDFRINNTALTEAIHQREEEEEEEEESEDEKVNISREVDKSNSEDEESENDRSRKKPRLEK